METQPPVTPIAVGVRYGLLTAAIAIILDFLLRIIGINVLFYGAATIVLKLSVAIGGVIFAHRAFRQLNGGLMSYGQGVLIAVLALTIWGLLSGLFDYVYFNYIDTDFIARMKDELKAFMERNRVPDDQIKKSTAGFDAMQQPLGKALLSATANGAVWGSVMGAIISIFTKRKHPEFE